MRCFQHDWIVGTSFRSVGPAFVICLIPRYHHISFDCRPKPIRPFRRNNRLTLIVYIILIAIHDSSERNCFVSSHPSAVPDLTHDLQPTGHESKFHSRYSPFCSHHSPNHRVTPYLLTCEWSNDIRFVESFSGRLLVELKSWIWWVNIFAFFYIVYS